MKMDYLCQHEVLHPKLLMQPITISSLRLTNPNDQNFIRKLLPDGVASVNDILLALSKRLCSYYGRYGYSYKTTNEEKEPVL